MNMKFICRRLRLPDLNMLPSFSTEKWVCGKERRAYIERVTEQSSWSLLPMEKSVTHVESSFFMCPNRQRAEAMVLRSLLALITCNFMVVCAYQNCCSLWEFSVPVI